MRHKKRLNKEQKQNKKSLRPLIGMVLFAEKVCKCDQLIYRPLHLLPAQKSACHTDETPLYHCGSKTRRIV